MIEFFEPVFSAEGIISLLTLAVLEVVLGIDNIVFISILAGKLEPASQKKARLIGLSLALVMRIILLFLIAWIVGFNKPIVEDFFGLTISVRSLILFLCGMFLIYKSTTEIHHKLEGVEENVERGKSHSVPGVIFQVVLLDMVFSFDSILTAIGVVEDPQRDVPIMVVAVVISMIVMLLFAKHVMDFINKHPTVKMLALSFLLMIGVLLVVESFEIHVPKGYIYFAMAFSLLVEILNMRMRKKSDPVQLRSSYKREKEKNEKK
jgi:predicted tellurium resistance membrane protein TerC